MLSLCGSHRTGKTTLAMAFAKENDIPFVQTSGSEVFEILGKDPKAEYPIEERIAIQEAILYAFERQYEDARSRAPVFIADRCPIDLASYMMADIQRSTLVAEPALAVMVNDYVRRCVESTSQWFSTVILVQPGIELVEAPGKAPACPAFIEHMNLLQTGLLLDERLLSRHYLIPKRYLTIEDRVRCVQGAVLHALEANMLLQKQRKDAGILLH